jgi:LysR family transcriptional regulator, benzoate and cis,cis-muconate-responsive activator of ben and cat genes
VDELSHRPPVSPYKGETLEEWLHLIGRGEGIDTAPAIIARYYSWPEVAFVPLVDAEPATVVLARRGDTADPLVSEFAALALEVATTAANNADTPYSAPASG